MATKTANIEAVGAGQTSATFTTTKEGADPVSLDIKIRVKAPDKVEEWLMLPLTKIGPKDLGYGPQYPISVFRGDRIIIQQGVIDFNSAFGQPNTFLFSDYRYPYNGDSCIIYNKARTLKLGRVEKMMGHGADKSEYYDSELMRLFGRNQKTNPELWFSKMEMWIVMDDITAPNELTPFHLSSYFFNTNTMYRPYFQLDYHGDMTRDEAITAGIKILDGNTDPNV